MGGPDRPSLVPISRRGLLAGLAATVAAPRLVAAGGPAESVHPFDGPWLTTAGIGPGDSCGAVTVDPGFAAQGVAPAPARLHGIVASLDGRWAVAVGRRPGRIALVIDRRSGAVATSFTPGEGRVFSGHGRYSADGRHFLTNEIERPDGTGRPVMGRGVVAVREAGGGFAIVAEWPSGGDGPHDLIHGGTNLIIANGGIEPNTPEARDAEATGSTITLLDPASGAVKGSAALPADLASLSLRHLAVRRDGAAVVAAQDLLKDGEARPLLFAVGRDGALSAFDAPDGAWRALRGYVGSVAFDPSGAFVACASPRGGQVSVWTAQGRHLGAIPLADGCGLAPGLEDGTFLATSGYGEVALIKAAPEGVGIIARRTGGPRYDNHVMRVTQG